MITFAQASQTDSLVSRINELQSALFYTESASLVKLPTHMISEVEVDTEGQIWFVIPAPAQHIDAFERELPAKMDFFRKGKEFFVKVRGTAHLIPQGEESTGSGMPEKVREKMKAGHLIAVRVGVQEARVVDNSGKPQKSFSSTPGWLRMGRTQLSSWFF